MNSQNILSYHCLTIIENWTVLVHNFISWWALGLWLPPGLQLFVAVCQNFSIVAVSQNFSIVKICDFYLQRVDKSLCVVVVFTPSPRHIQVFMFLFYALWGFKFVFFLLCSVCCFDPVPTACSTCFVNVWACNENFCVL